ncbi:hypothetical protein BIFANG_03346 [Bifidobacterium angulatum DSM 20098 = JCM 7096]|nr:hypothetical protein BIFANG_03346 [Bifidobacterium angulatum DSM 20098 = JCM 7096]
MCGEHPVSMKQALPSSGSSPRVRGTLGRVRVEGLALGIIPACAGNTI